ADGAAVAAGAFTVAGSAAAAALKAPATPQYAHVDVGGEAVAAIAPEAKPADGEAAAVTARVGTQEACRIMKTVLPIVPNQPAPASPTLGGIALSMGGGPALAAAEIGWQ